ncbi:MAG: tetratricopeptide repeat protein [Proteobacteria bacterium]|nr:tetratricopeptide repeat protein [Pseudomonadota bacterium]MBI3499272.1 tetratricopeptide repeat protein [Pseudomonadota bacterium]
MAKGAGTVTEATTEQLLAQAAQDYAADRLEAAAKGLEAALKRQPLAAALYTNLAVVFERMGDPRARGRLSVALALAPSLAVAWFNLGNRHAREAAPDAAARVFRRVLALDGRHVGALTNLANALRDGDSFDAALGLYRRALSLDPGAAESLYNYGTALHLAGEVEGAARAYRLALARTPHDAWRLRLATLLPPISDTEAMIEGWRRRFEQGVARLAAAPLAIADPLHDCHWTNFYLAYHDRDDRVLQERASRLWLHASPSLGADLAPPAPRAGSKIRLGFVSAYFKAHTIGSLFQGVIEAIDRTRFTVVVCQCGPAEDAMGETIQALADEYLTLPLDLDQARSRIAAARLDALLYTDIGMDPMTYYLAHARLARLQLATWGHPVTTGIAAIDHFISAKDFDADGADAHYSERLVRLDALLLCWQPQPIDLGATPRAKLGLAEGGRAYLCAQSLFKLHPRFDAVLARILAEDDRAVLHFIEGHRRPWCDRIQARLGRLRGDAQDRVRFLPRLSAEDFVRAMAAADAVLDTPGFSGGKTSLECLATATPVVTMPSAYLRGRLTYGFYCRIGIEDCIAKTPEDYARIAVRLAQEPDWRAEIAARIGARAPSLFGTTPPVREFEAFLAERLSR